MGSLHAWFGKSRKEVWRKLAAELEARYVAGTWRKSDRIEVEHGAWTITLDVYTVMAGNTPLHFTRFRAPYRNAENLRLRIYRSSFFSTIGSWLGMQDIEIGAGEFDRDFVVKANDEAAARRFCADVGLRRAMHAEPSFDLQLRDDEGWFGPKYPPGTDVLSVIVRGHLADAERLRGLFDLFATALDRLCAIGAAYEGDPGIEL